MTGKTHLTAGLVTALALGVNVPQMVLIAAGSMLPDMDHAGSTLGKKIKPISKHLRHRGPTHSLLFLVLISLISPYLGIGVLTHMVLDMLNPKGIELLYPCKVNIKIPLLSKYIKTGGPVESVIFILLIAAGIFLLIFCQNVWGSASLVSFIKQWFPNIIK